MPYCICFITGPCQADCKTRKEVTTDASRRRHALSSAHPLPRCPRRGHPAPGAGQCTR
ncbi:DUF630 domain-containing protein [Massilia arenae]|uniref:DUF630 domain-containing protein n=1 Tax=Massilia arenae TaxID=2603288 RepID=A0A5C7FZR2_9BURK|nr:DUF630 domain-containing protein [Massilia arenae]